MDYSKKVHSVPNICKVYFDFTGKSLALNPNQPSFIDTILSNGLVKETYFHKTSVQFTETSSEGVAGIKYEQTFSITFNSNDAKRYQRIHDLHKVNHIIIQLTNGEHLVFGRNDYFQNKKPICTTSNTHVKTSAEFYCESIIPISKYLGNVLVGLPGIIPLDFIN